MVLVYRVCLPLSLPAHSQCCSHHGCNWKMELRALNFPGNHKAVALGRLRSMLMLKQLEENKRRNKRWIFISFFLPGFLSTNYHWPLLAEYSGFWLHTYWTHYCLIWLVTRMGKLNCPYKKAEQSRFGHINLKQSRLLAWVPKQLGILFPKQLQGMHYDPGDKTNSWFWDSLLRMQGMPPETVILGLQLCRPKKLLS